MKVIRIGALLIFCGLLVFILLILWSPGYHTLPLKKRDNLKYWGLQTGSTIAYTLLAAEGAKQPFPVLYLHGGPGAGITDRELKVLSGLTKKGFEVYLYDQVGCGHSERLETIREYTAGRHLRDLEAIVQQIGAPKVSLIGQSWGSNLAEMYLAAHPEKVEKLVIAAAAPLQPANKTMETVKAPDSLALAAPSLDYRIISRANSSIRSKAMVYAARKWGIKIVSDKQADAFATFFTTALNRSMVCDTTQAVIAESTEGFYVHHLTSISLGKTRDLRSTLQKLSTPVLLMKAQCDNQPWGYTAEYFTVFQNIEFAFVRGAGHNIFLEKPDEYIDLISRFLMK